MQKLMKVALACVSVALLSFTARAEQYVIPFDNNGNLPGDINMVGGDVFVDTGLAPIGSTSPIALYGYSVSSDAVTNFAMLRDSATLNTTSNIKMTLYPDIYSTSGAQTNTVRFPIPILFRNGLSINLNAVVTGATGTKGRWMFYVRYLKEGSVPGKKPSDVNSLITIDNVGVN